MAARKFRKSRFFSGSSEARESRFQESELIHSPPASNIKKPTHFDRTASAGCVGYLALLLVFVVLILLVAMGIRFSGLHSWIPYTVTLGDTTLVPSSSFWCEQMVVTGSNRKGNPPLSLSLYLIAEQPPLTKPNRFKVEGTFTIDQTMSKYAQLLGWYDYNYDFSDIHPVTPNFVSWKFYLYSNSQFTLEDACIESGGDAEFILIQGDEDFKAWLAYELQPQLVVHISSCAVIGSGASLGFEYTSPEEGNYYFIFHSKDTTPPQINTAMMFDRYEYSVEGLQVLENCTITTNQLHDPCTLSPGDFYFYVLLVAHSEKDPTKNITYGTMGDFDMMCLPRGSTYAVIFFVPVITMSIIGAAILCICLRRRKSRNYNIIGSTPRREPSYVHLPPPPYSPSVL